MDNLGDFIYESALKDLERYKTSTPCGIPEKASDLLSEFCLCGWELAAHYPQEEAAGASGYRRIWP